MSTTQVSIRLGVEGKAEVKRAFDDVGKAGQDAFRGVTTAMDATGAATDRETQRLQRLAQAAKQAAAAGPGATRLQYRSRRRRRAVQIRP